MSLSPSWNSLPENGREVRLTDPLATQKNHNGAKDQSNDEEQRPSVIDADTSLALGTHQTTSDRAPDPNPSSPKYTGTMVLWSGTADSDSDNNDEENKEEIPSGTENLVNPMKNDDWYEKPIAGLSRFIGASQEGLPGNGGDNDSSEWTDEEDGDHDNSAEDLLKAASKEDEVESENPTDPIFPGAWPSVFSRPPKDQQ